jgi:hypothetical protein
MGAIDWNAALNGLILFAGGGISGYVARGWRDRWHRWRILKRHEARHGGIMREPPWRNPPRVGPSDAPKLRLRDE